MFPLQQVYGCMAKKATNMLCTQLLAFLKLKMVLFRGLEARLNGRPLAQHACNPEVWYPAPHRHTRCFFNGIENPLALSIYIYMYLNLLLINILIIYSFSLWKMPYWISLCFLLYMRVFLRYLSKSEITLSQFMFIFTLARYCHKSSIMV